MLNSARGLPWATELSPGARAGFQAPGFRHRAYHGRPRLIRVPCRTLAQDDQRLQQRTSSYVRCNLGYRADHFTAQVTAVPTEIFGAVRHLTRDGEHATEIDGTAVDYSASNPCMHSPHRIGRFARVRRETRITLGGSHPPWP